MGARSQKVGVKSPLLGFPVSPVHSRSSSVSVVHYIGLERGLREESHESKETGVDKRRRGLTTSRMPSVTLQ